MMRKEIEEYIQTQYNSDIEYPWLSAPDYAVFRHKNNRKWFALIMNIPKSKLNLDSDEMVNVINLKGDPIEIGSLRLRNGFHPAWHMNKEKWITIRLDGSVDIEEIKQFIDISYQLTK